MRNLKFTVLAASLPLLVSSVHAQSVAVFGSGTISAGANEPRVWVRGEPRIGNASFEVTVDRGPNQGLAVLLLGSDRGQGSLLGVDLLVDLMSPIFTTSAVLALDSSGQGGVSLPIPLDPAFVDLELYAQWAVADSGSPGGVGASDGLALRIQDANPVLLGASTLGVQTLELSGGTTSTPWSLLFPFVEGQISRDGQSFVVGASTFVTGNCVKLYDATQTPLAPQSVVGPSLRWIDLHPHRDVGFGIRNNSTSLLDVVDLDRGSPTFGRVLRSITTVTLGLVHSVSADGRRLLYFSGFGGLELADVDPDSPNRDTVLGSVPGTFPIGPRYQLSPDASTFYSYGFGSAVVAEIETATGNELRQTSPLPAAVEILYADPRGRFLFLTLENGAFATVDLEPGPNAFTARVTQTPATSAPVVAFTADYASVVQALPGQIVIYDLDTHLPFFDLATTFATDSMQLR